MAELQQQVQDAARDNAVLSKAMNNLLAAAVEVDTTAEDAAEETANLMALAQATKAASANLAEDELNRIEAMQAQLEADYAEAGNGEVSREDLALIIVNARKFAPQAISKDGSGSQTSITRVDTAIYSATDKDSEMYIAPMDGSYIRDGEVYYFNTDNPSANKFVISNFIDDNEDREGNQTTYVINYTAGNLVSNADGAYTFNGNQAAPKLVGYAQEDLDTALKFVSEADLMNYGATAVSGEVGNQVFEWNGTPGTRNQQPLTDLDGNVITQAGWYDFTRRSEDGDGGLFIYGTYADGNWSISMDPTEPIPEGAIRRIIGLELKFTDNMFGDKDPTIGTIVDPFGTGSATGSEAELLSARAAEGMEMIDPAELQELRSRSQSQSQILITSSEFSSGSTGILDTNGFGYDELGVGSGDFAAMSLDNAVDTEAGDSFGEGQGVSNSSSTSIDEQITSFLEGEGESDGDAEEARGQNAEGQGQGEGGEAALGEDQSPTTQRKRGLLLQPIVQQAVDEDESQSTSRLLKNLSEGSVLGNNLLDALTLGGGILYALYAPQLVQTSRNSFRSFFSSLQQRFNGGTVVIPEKNVASVFVMKRPDGTERLVAARVTASAIDIIAQQDLPSGVSVLQSGTQTQIDYGMKQLLSRISGSSFDLLLIGPRLSNQATLTQSLSSDVQVLDTSGIESRLGSCSEAEVTELRQWLDKPSSTPLEQNPLNDLLMNRQTVMESILKKEQASMAGLLELSIALSWKDSN